MELPIQVAVRVYPCVLEDPPCVQAIPITPTFPPNRGISNIASSIIQVGAHSFPVTHSLPIECSQSQVYHQTVYPLISLFLEGFDASVVTYGQKGTGKSYTLYGPGFDCVYGEAEQGIVQRCVREIFAQLANFRERNFGMHIAWVEIRGDEIRDILEAGSVPCTSVSDVFHWIQIGMTNRSTSKDCVHNLFTITLEQQWVSAEGLIQHRLSTASFSDLCGSERMYMMNSMDQHLSVPKDLGLQALEKIVANLTDPTMPYNNNNIQYIQTTLTTLLKDSFGGRAQTLLILCVSPLERDINETTFNLQFAFKAQCIRNYVIMNTYSDNNTPISPDVVPEMIPEQTDTFGLQFAATQWLKLVSNAEGLFSKLVSLKTLSDTDKEQIEEWLFLKQECEECLSSSEINFRSPKQLGPIQETEEPDETGSDCDDVEASLQQNSDNESDSESQRPDLVEKVENLMDELRLKTDNLVQEKYQEFIESQPKAVMESNESLRPLEDRRASSSLGGRRRSIQPGATLSSAEIAMLNRVANRNSDSQQVEEDEEQSSTNHHYKSSSNDFLIDTSTEMNSNHRHHHHHSPQFHHSSPVDTIQKKLRKICIDIEAKQREIKELEHTISEKKGLLNDLSKNEATRTSAEQRFKKKRDTLEAKYEKTKKQLSKAVVNGRKSEIEHFKQLTSDFEQRLQDLQSIKNIAGDSAKKVKKLKQSLQESKKQLSELNKELKKIKKIKDQLESELKTFKEKENSNNSATGGGSGGISSIGNKTVTIDDKSKNLKQVQARISHLDHVLKEKSQNLEQFKNGGENSSEQEQLLRHEIRNLRSTRDQLVKERCVIDSKFKKDKILSHREERKLLECDEAIEAIDAAIEFKNEMICGRRSIDTSGEKLQQREKGEKMLMERLNNLSLEEMRTLLYKYFTKVIDLRDSSRKLELQLMELERKKDELEWHKRALSNAVRQVRLEGERKVILLQRQHETKLALMLRHLTNETSLSNSSFSDRMLHPTTTAAAAAGIGTVTAFTSSPTSPSPYSDPDFDSVAAAATVTAKHLIKSPTSKHHPDLDMCPLSDVITKYKPLDKIKEKERESKNKLFAKFQVLTRYHSGGNGGTNNHHAIGNDLDHLIPEENLKKLQLAPPPATKVTRQKNKIIIQNSPTSRKD